MRKILLFSFLPFVIFFGINFASASEPTEVPLDDNIYRSSCYSGTADFYTDIPYSYSGNTVRLYAKVPTNPSGCADLGIDLCDWSSFCYVNVTPGQRLNFRVSIYCGYCGDYENESWYVYAYSVACGDGSCNTSGGENCSNCSSDCACSSYDCCYPSSSNADSKGCVDSGDITSSGYICCSGDRYYGTCCSDSDCASGYECSSHKCVKELYCGDGICNTSGGENCSNCSSDCSCYSSYCCYPTSYNANLSGCVASGEFVSSSYLCCSGSQYYGNCCSDSDCASGYECSSHKCVKESYCGDGSCDASGGENCSNCSSDCACSSYDCCYPSSSNADSKGCVDSGDITSSGYICCSGDRYYGTCCSDSDCYSGYNCSGHACVKSAYCGDGTCSTSSGENCSTCSSDCGCSSYDCCSVGSYSADSKGCVDSGDATSSGYICCSGSKYSGNCCNDSGCSSGYKCSSHKCVKELYCGDGTCDSTESCTSCSSDCGACPPQEPSKKVDGSACSSGSECQGGYCLHGYCRSSSIYCGDSYCDDGEKCQNCSSDCGTCKSDREYCDYSWQCKSGNCQNYRCCVKGKTCCLATSNCPSEYYCSEDRSYCLPGKPNGQLCTKDEYCKSGNCDYGICCEWGQDCCQKHNDCSNSKYCDGSVNYCRYKWSEGNKCGETAMCYSNYCDRSTWTCAEKPDDYEDQPSSETQQSETPAQTAPAVDEAGEAVEGEIILSVPKIIELKRTEEYSPVISISNNTDQTVVLGDRIQIFNNIPALVDIDKPVLRILGTKELGPGEKLTIESESIDYLIEDLILKAERAGKGEIQFNAVYFLNNQAKKITQEMSLVISSEHVQREEGASEAFEEDMILTEKREVTDTVSGATKEYVFVEPEEDLLYHGSTNGWQIANEEVKEQLNKLKDDFIGSYDPEVVSFFKTIKELEAAETPDEITEITLRTIAPPAVIAAFDFVNLLDAIDEQKKEEEAFLNHFGASAFTDVPVYNSAGELIGYSRAVLKEEDGIIYAVKIGNL